MPAPELTIKTAEEVGWDFAALGEVMLRLDPGEDRIAQARSFRVWEGGGEYNVGRGLRRCFGLRSTIVTAQVANPVGRLVEDLMLQGGVDTSHVLWREDDGIGQASRNGLYFLERGFGVRGALGSMDRGHTAVSQFRPGEIDWDHLFGSEGVRWFHTGGIFCALGAETTAVAREAVAAAKRHGAVVSYDCNYRPSLWRARGGRLAATAVNRDLAPYVDVLFGHEGDLAAELSDATDGLPAHTAETYAAMASRLVTAYPNIKVVATTTRRAHTASRNDWGAYAFAGGELHTVHEMRDLDVYDRVGSGDAFAAGMIAGLLNGRGVGYALRCGLAHGALTMTTAGDSSCVTEAEVGRLMQGLDAGVQR